MASNLGFGRHLLSCCTYLPRWRSNRLFSRQDFDDDHGSAAVETDKSRLGNRIGIIAEVPVDGHNLNLEYFAYLCQLFTAAVIGQQPIMPNAMKTTGRHMQQEAAYELVCIERHGFLPRLALRPVVFPAERDTPLVHGNQS